VTSRVTSRGNGQQLSFEIYEAVFAVKSAKVVRGSLERLLVANSLPAAFGSLRDQSALRSCGRCCRRILLVGIGRMRNLV
jgi:hypothetical protein